ncbi:galactokinase [Methylocystis sp. SB2]|uniref:galactokinase n=1 Tax=Methylocystis sp. (strain SB2) TaxID=743836 RepID=UPI00041BC794|nr:galactokinase [Methylocystis sp. SB2]ULO22924.1 galactokinase [Methylocystis sp. SB2]
MESRIEQDLIAAFRRSFEREPRLFRAPGRINLIGEHTDYNDGFVMPAALDLSIWAAIAPRSDRRLRIGSLVMDEVVEFDLDDANAQPRGDWTDYVRGVAIFLERAGYELNGADLVLDGNLPIGAGLSASAAFEVSAGFALLTISGAKVDRVELAKICQRAENQFVGVRCGIMDQYISCCAVEGSALLLDCRSLVSRKVTIDPDARLVICDTMVRHQLASDEYNSRREDCERAVAALSTRIDGIAALRDVTFAQLMRYGDSMPELIFRRARHVVGEIDRTLRAAAALDAGDLNECGRLMYLSHESLRDDYEVSCAELDLMVDIARSLPGVYGARMMGGGFGGCTINLVEASRAEAFAQAMADKYRTATGVTPPILTCVPGPGAGPVGD